MTLNSRKTTLFFAALLGLAVVQPLAASAGSPNQINNQTVDTQLAQAPMQPYAMTDIPRPVAAPHSGAGIYDRLDQYKDSRGFPLPGTAQMFQPVD